jgi:hypothetical protein
MMIYDLPGDMIIGRVRQSIHDLLRISDYSCSYVGPLSEFPSVVIAQGATDTTGVVQIIGILPVKEQGTEHFISVLRSRRNVEKECEVTEMLEYAKRRAKAVGAERMYYTAKDADARLERVLQGVGFEYESRKSSGGGDKDACIEMVLHVSSAAV